MAYNYNNRIVRYQNEKKDLILFVFDENDNPYDITNYNGSFIAKKYPVNYNNLPDISLGYENKDISTGSFLFKLDTTGLNPGDYQYEFIIDDSSNRFTVISDRLQVLKSL